MGSYSSSLHICLYTITCGIKYSHFLQLINRSRKDYSIGRPDPLGKDLYFFACYLELSGSSDKDIPCTLCCCFGDWPHFHINPNSHSKCGNYWFHLSIQPINSISPVDLGYGQVWVKKAGQHWSVCGLTGQPSGVLVAGDDGGGRVTYSHG